MAQTVDAIRQARGKLCGRYSVEAILAEREFFSRYLVWDERAAARRLVEIQQVPAEEQAGWLARARLARRLRHPALLSCLEAYWVAPQHGLVVVEEPPAGEPPPHWGVDQVLCAGLAVSSALALLHSVGLRYGAPMVDPVFWQRDGHRTRIRVDLLTRAIGGFWREPICANALPFVPPEVVSGATPSAASDLFVLGTMLFWLLEGSPPPADGLAEVEEAEAGLGGEMAKLLEKDPARRPASAKEACRSLFRLLRLRGVGDRPPCFGRVLPEPGEPAGPASANDYVVPLLSRAVVEQLTLAEQRGFDLEKRLTEAIWSETPAGERPDPERPLRLARAGEIEKALSLSERSSEPAGSVWRAGLLWRAGRSEQALAEAEGSSETEAIALRAAIARERGLQDQAEELLATAPEVTAIQIERARLHLARGRLTEGLLALQEAATGTLPRVAGAQARGLLARTLARLGRLREASDEIVQALDLLDAGEDEAELRSLRVVRAEVDLLAGRWQKARSALSGELQAARRAGDRKVLQQALLLLAEVEIGAGEESSAARTLDEALALAAVRRDQESRARGLVLRLEAQASQGDWGGVRARARALLRSAALAGLPWERTRLLLMVARAALEGGHMRRFRHTLKEARLLLAKLGDPVLASVLGCLEALALARTGEEEKAAELFERSALPVEGMSLAYVQARLYADFVSEPAFSRFAERVRLRREAAERIARGLGAASLLRRLESSTHRPRGAVAPVRGIVASSAAMRSVLADALNAARFDVPVHLSGESGTGKELLARAIHQHSPRAARGDFVAVNCGAIPDSLLEAELFGHARGAFTGADRCRSGLIEQAHGGTLLLDEVADLSARGQTLLLRVLQEKEYRRLGESEPRRSDFRLISASHKCLAEEVAAGRFREDLYFRIRVIVVDLPPLRERTEDILPLARNAVSRKAAELGLPVAGLSEKVERALLAHGWPGNVRELENEVVQALLRLGSAAAIDLEHLSPRLAGERPPPIRSACSELERRLLEQALERHGGNRTRTARDLGLTRQALYLKIRRYRLEPAPVRASIAQASQVGSPSRASWPAVGNASTRYLSG